MTFEQILELLNDTTLTRYQLAANIHALVSKASTPSALNIKPKVERAKRGANKATKVQVSQPTFTNGEDHVEAN
jgi:hypothetical protein